MNFIHSEYIVSKKKNVGHYFLSNPRIYQKTSQQIPTLKFNFSFHLYLFLTVLPTWIISCKKTVVTALCTFCTTDLAVPVSQLISVLFGLLPCGDLLSVSRCLFMHHLNHVPHTNMKKLCLMTHKTKKRSPLPLKTVILFAHTSIFIHVLITS